MHLIFKDDEDFLSVEDVRDVEDFGILEVENRHFTRREVLKEFYKLQLYLVESGNARGNPCPICLTETGGTRTCRYCGIISCNHCYSHKWYGLHTAKRTRSGNYLIEDKRCPICHLKCGTCCEVYPRGDKLDHKCPDSVFAVSM